MGSVLREGWEIRNFESCINKVIYTKKIKRKEFLSDGDYPIVSQEKSNINGYWDNANDLFNIKKPVVIFGDHTQVLKYIDFNFILGADGVKILETKDDIEPRYFYYYLQSVNLGTLGYARHYRLLKEIEITYPKSLQEQEKIVAILDEAFSAIEKAKANAELNLKNAKELFESYLQSVFENNGEGWEENTLEKILLTQPKNGWSPPAKNQSDSGIPVLTLSAVTGFVFNPLSVKYTEALSKPDARYWVNNGDLLITRSNTPELVGHVAICSSINEPTIYPDLIMKINPNKKIITTEFLFYQLKSPKLREIIKEAAHGANPTMKKINKTDVQNFKICYPKIKTQKTIVKKLDTLSEQTKNLEKIYEQKIKDLEELKKSILQKAFNGELL